MMTASTLKPAPFSRSRSSDSSASSLSSTFSDIITSSISDSSSTSKTNAFFASPFSTQPPSPIQLEKKSAPPPTRSLTADFFATPVRPPSPPTTTTTTTTVKRQRTIHPSRIFPSRYTSTVEHSPDFVSLDFTLSPKSHDRSPSSGSDSSFTSFVETHLPTPPPPVLPLPFTTIQGSNFESSSSEPTPRPPDLEPTLLHFERSLLFAAQEKQRRDHQPQPEPESELVSDDDAEVEEEPHSGSIISLNTEHPISRFSLSPLALTFGNPSLQDDCGTSTPTNEPSSKPLKSTTSSVFSSLPTSPSTLDDSESTPTLRLLRTLGHGAFSAVWLAEDFSRVPLTLVSKKSVRDLRRRVSGRDKERKEKERERGDKKVERFKDEEKITKDATKTLERPPRNLRDGLKSILSFSRLPKLAPSTSCTDDCLSKSSLDIEPSSWNGYDLPSSTSLLSHQDIDLDMDSSSISRTSSIRSSSSYSSFSGGGVRQPSRMLPSPGVDMDSSSLSRTSSIHSSSSYSPFSGGGAHRFKLPSPGVIRDDLPCLSRDSSLKKFRDRVRGTRPADRLGRAYLDERHGEMGWKERGMGEEAREDEKEGGQIHLGPNLSRHLSLRSNTVNNGTNGRLVAVKMTPRKVRGAKGKRERAEEERTRVGFVREVEVLKHISHPNITPLLAHLSTSTHHILVLPYLPGGDLLGLVNNDIAWGKLGESVLKRIWCELCKAVGWMHGVGLVHRDIKLENILLTTLAFNSLTPTSPPPTLSCLPTPPAPFIKLTDFGLSRFVEIDANGEAELLWTRCGSEAYAAPELVTGGGGSAGGGSREGGGESARRGVYDARKTDAWACGVVLYALVARHLPFGEGVGAQPVGGGNRIGGGRGAGRGSAAERRHWLMRIARGEYEWPGDQGEGVEESRSEVEVEEKEKDELVGSDLMHSQGARRIVGRLLIRDPRKRARIGDLWDDSWMTLIGGGDEVWWKERGKEREWYDSCLSSSMITRTTSMEGSLSESHDHHGHEDGHEDVDVQGRTVWIFDQAEVGDDPLRELEEDEAENGEEEGEEEEEEGCLFDHEGIDSITRQEVV